MKAFLVKVMGSDLRAQIAAVFDDIPRVDHKVDNIPRPRIQGAAAEESSGSEAGCDTP